MNIHVTPPDKFDAKNDELAVLLESGKYDATSTFQYFIYKSKANERRSWGTLSCGPGQFRFNPVSPRK